MFLFTRQSLLKKVTRKPQAERLCVAPFLRHLNSDALSPLEKSAEQPPIEKVPSPAYSDTYGHVDFSQNGLDTQARVACTASLTNVGFGR